MPNNKNENDIRAINKSINDALHRKALTLAANHHAFQMMEECADYILSQPDMTKEEQALIWSSLASKCCDRADALLGMNTKN